MSRKVNVRNVIINIVLIAFTLIYAINYIAPKLLFQANIGFDGLNMAMLRNEFCAISFLLTITIVSLTKRTFLKDIKEHIGILKGRRGFHIPFLLFIAALLMPILSQTLFFEGLKRTTSFNSVIMRMAITGVGAYIMAIFFKQEIPSRRKILGIGLALISAVALMIVEASPSEISGWHINWIGDLMVLGSGLAFGLYTVIAKNLITESNLSPLSVLAWSFCIGTIILMPFFYSSYAWDLGVQWSALEMSHWLILGFILLIATYVAFLLNISILKNVAASTAASFTYIQPIFVGAITYFVLGEHLPYIGIFFAGLAILGVIILSSKTSWGTYSEKAYEKLPQSFINVSIFRTLLIWFIGLYLLIRDNTIKFSSLNKK